MKRIISLILGVLSLGVVVIAQPVPPDVYLQWMKFGIPITTAPYQVIPIPLPQNGISRYSYHYVYLFFDGACSSNDISVFTTATISGYVPDVTTGEKISLGGLVTQNYSTGGHTGPVLVIKGNGAVNSLTASLYLTSNNTNTNACTISVLYKGTIKEEEGQSPSGVYNPDTVSMDTSGNNPVVVVGAKTTTYTFNVPTYGSATGHEATVSFQQITFCVLPNSTGVFSGTMPALIIPRMYYGDYTGNSKPLGRYTVTNGCYTLGPIPAGIGVLQPGNTLTVDFVVSNTTTFLDYSKELWVNVLGKVLY